MEHLPLVFALTLLCVYMIGFTVYLLEYRTPLLERCELRWKEKKWYQAWTEALIVLGFDKLAYAIAIVSWLIFAGFMLSGPTQ